jgi:hypothetical protein
MSARCVAKLSDVRVNRLIIPSDSDILVCTLIAAVSLQWRKFRQNEDLTTELLGFWIFSIVWYSTEHDVSETGSVSVLR